MRCIHQLPADILGKPPNCTTFRGPICTGAADNPFDSETPRVSTTEPWPKFRIRGGGGGHFLREFKDEHENFVKFGIGK